MNTRVVLIAIVVMTIALPCHAVADDADDVVGSPAPELVFRTADGQPVNSSDWNGRPRLIAVVSLTMPEGKQLLELLARLSSRHAGDALIIVAVEINHKRADIGVYQQQHSLPFTMVYGNSKEIMARLSMHYLPTIYVIDASDTIRAVIHKKDALNESALDQAISQALGQ